MFPINYFSSQQVECSDGQIGYGRRRRSLPTMPADPNKIFEITITSFIKVNYEDGAENSEGAPINQTTFLNNKKLVVGNQTQDKKFYRVDETPSSIAITREDEYTSIVAESGSMHLEFRVPLLMLIVFRLLL